MRPDPLLRFVKPGPDGWVNPLRYLALAGVFLLTAVLWLVHPGIRD